MIKMYVQRSISTMDIIDFIGFNLGVNKHYSIKKGKSFNPSKQISEDNFAYLSNIVRADNCSMDSYVDKNGVSYVAMTDPFFLFHGFKIEDEPYTKKLNGTGVSVEFMETDTISLALAVNIVNTLGGYVTIDENIVHKCLNKNCKFPLLEKKEMKEALEEDDNVNFSNNRYYKKENLYRDACLISTDLINELQNAHPYLDMNKEALKRLRIFKEYSQDSSRDKNKIIMKMDR